MSKDRVLVAMSGGVDSSIAAFILKNEGYEVIGATIKIWPKEYCGRDGGRTCCSLRDIDDAKKVCENLGIRHYVFNFYNIFKEEVIDYFVREYLSGRTPNPCIVCNERIKFGKFLEKALELDCRFVATGHYARIEREDGVCRLKEAYDKRKDQSYVLFSLKDFQLQNILLPLGDINKDEVRVLAKRLGLKVHDKPESQDICFVREGDYTDFIRQYIKKTSMKGEIVDTSGRLLGYHDGYWNFTIGQRRGLGIAYKRPLYVIDIQQEKNLLVVGDFSELKKRRFLVKDINWIGYRSSGSIEASVKIRYAHKKAGAVIKQLEDDTVEVEFKEPQEAITPGQAAVFYDGEYVLGGGWIAKVFN